MPKTKFDSTFLLRCVCFSSPNPSSSINQRIIETQGAAHRDIGADSVTSLPLREWAHVAFTFKNHSKLSSAAGDLGDSSGGVVEHQQPPPPPELVGNVHGHHFSFGFFLNGYHDVTANFPAPVEANGDDLRVGKDPSNRGPRGTLLAHPFRTAHPCIPPLRLQLATNRTEIPLHASILCMRCLCMLSVAGQHKYG